jgi:hypothetical protein
MERHDAALGFADTASGFSPLVVTRSAFADPASPIDVESR